MKVSLLKVDKSLLKKSSDPIIPSLEKGYKIYEYENLKAGDVNFLNFHWNFFNYFLIYLDKYSIKK